MPAQWTGELVGKMHNNRVSSQELAAKIGCSTKWLSMVLNGHCMLRVYPPTLTLNARCLQEAEKHLAASLLPHFLAYFRGFSSSSSRSVIFRRLMPRVDPLCSSAEVAGGSTPATPSAISVRLKPTINR